MKKLLGIGAVLAIIVYGVFLLVPQSVPLLDRNRQLLAESPRDAFCSGVVLMQTRGYGSAEQMAECLEENGRSTEKDLDAVQPTFCDGVRTMVGMPTDECVGIMTSNQYWPTLQGTVTNAWNKAFPYPGAHALDSGEGARSSDSDRATDHGLIDPTDR